MAADQVLLPSLHLHCGKPVAFLLLLFFLFVSSLSLSPPQGCLGTTSSSNSPRSMDEEEDIPLAVEVEEREVEGREAGDPSSSSSLPIPPLEARPSIHHQHTSKVHSAPHSPHRHQVQGQDQDQDQEEEGCIPNSSSTSSSSSSTTSSSSRGLPRRVDTHLHLLEWASPMPLPQWVSLPEWEWEWEWGCRPRLWDSLSRPRT